jgi:predicted nuclease with TOPRIM domain
MSSTPEQELSEVKNRLKRLEMENKDLSFKLQNKTKEVEGLQEENKNLETNLSKMNKGMISDLITDLNAQLTKSRAQNKKLKESLTTFENLGDIETKIKYYTSEI